MKQWSERVLEFAYNEQGKSSVWALVLDDEYRILLLKRSKKMNNPGLWNLPGGGVEPKENIEKAMWRELGEEAGFKREQFKIASRFKIRLKDTGKYLTVFVLLSHKRTPKPRLNSESSNYQWIKLKKALEIPTSKLHVPSAAILRSAQLEHHLETFDEVRQETVKSTVKEMLKEPFKAHVAEQKRAM